MLRHGKPTARKGRPRGSLAITVQRREWRRLRVEATDPIGSPHKPLSEAQFEAKFRDCAANARHPLSAARVDNALATIARLEILPDARTLLTLFAD